MLEYATDVIFSLKDGLFEAYRRFESEFAMNSGREAERENGNMITIAQTRLTYEDKSTPVNVATPMRLQRSRLSPKRAQKILDDLANRHYIDTFKTRLAR
jgi:hypothetical protein